jgi:16S rRNA pseudouridine516 synthase
MPQLRLDKLIASMGDYSRSEVKRLVKDGRVTVGGLPAPSADVKCDAESALIAIDGKPLLYSEHTYVMMNKPEGYLSATEDMNRETVLDLLPKELRNRALFPVGRLDRDTVGLLLITNDGALAHRLLSPKHHVDKVYFARTEGKLDAEDEKAFAEGITLGDGFECMSAGLRIISAGETSEALVTVREGKFHQVKRMLASRGKPVTYLRRISMGTLTVDESLAPGEWRYLTDKEIDELKKCADMEN